MDKLLLDTGPLVALLDRSEKNHERCVSFLKEYRGDLITTETVITEAMYLLNDSLAAQKACIELLIKAPAQIVPSTHASLKTAMKLMEKYQNIPMDFADATLVLIAEETGIGHIFTLDWRGFEIYRYGRNKSFAIYPALSA